MAHAPRSPAARPHLVLRNANVITLDDRLPRASAVTVRGGVIAWVGRDEGLGRVGLDAERVVDCEGRTLIPGFVDAHMHLLAYAASLRDVDCGADAVQSISDIRSAIAERARGAPEGAWVVGRAGMTTRPWWSAGIQRGETLTPRLLFRSGWCIAPGTPAC